MTQYKHEKLATGYIRLIAIDTEWPGDQSSVSGGLLNCSIEHFPLANAPAYYALSYVWGSSEIQIPIILNNCTFSITDNLSSALDTIRMLSRMVDKSDPDDVFPTHLWVDAICIDQKNDTEKAEQIQLMRNIYQSANFVVAWLGPHHPEARASSNYFMDIDGMMNAGTLPAGLWDDGQLAAYIKEDIRHGSPHGNFLDRVYENPFWNRIWILQELAVSRQILFLSDKIVMREEVFLPVFLSSLRIRIPLAARADSTTVLVRQNRTNPWAMIYGLLNRRLPEPGPLSLMEFLIHVTHPTSHFVATDPRDMIYSLLGLAGDSDTLGIVPNYSKQWTEVYREVAIKLLQNHGLDVLAFAGSSITNPYLYTHLRLITGHYLPSWVPNWRQPRLVQLGSYNPGTRTGVMLSIEDLPNGLHTIKLKGCMWDRVKTYGQVWLNDHPGRSIEVVHQWLDELDKMVNENQNGERIHEGYSRSAAFWTPVAGGDSSLEPADSQKFVEAYNHLRSSHVSSHDAAPSYDRLLEKSKPYLKMMYYKADRRRVIITEKGWVGLGPVDTRPGDIVVMFPGYDGCFILRTLDNGGLWFLIGEAYLYELSWKLLDDQEWEYFEFQIS